MVSFLLIAGSSKVESILVSPFPGGFSDDNGEVLPTLIYSYNTQKWRLGAPLPHSASSMGRSFGSAPLYHYTFLAVGGEGAPEGHGTQMYEPTRDEWLDFNQDLVGDRSHFVSVAVPTSYASCNAFRIPDYVNQAVVIA